MKNNFYKNTVVFLLLSKRMVVLLFVVVCLFQITVNASSSHDYIHYRLGLKYKNEGKYDQAIEEFRRVLSVYPDNYNAYMHLAEIREKQGRNRLAIFYLQTSLKYNPGWGKAQKKLAAIYMKDKRYQNAIEQWQSYKMTCDPQERDSVQNVIDNILRSMKGNEAEFVSDQAASTEKRDGESQKKGTGQSTRTVKKTPGISNANAALVEKEFNKGAALYEEGVQKGERKKFDAALDHFHNALKLNPGHSGVYYYAGLIRRRYGQNKMAKINFEKSLSYPELGYNAHFYLGKIYGEEKGYKKAIEHLKKYVAATDYGPGKREAENLINRYQTALRNQGEDTPVFDIEKLTRDELHKEISKVPPEVKLAKIEVRIDSLLTMVVVDTLTDRGQKMLEGVMAFKEGKYETTIKIFRKLQISNPKNDISACCIYNIGVCYMKLKNYKKAENQFQQVLDKHGSQEVASKSLFLKALSYFERKQSDVAEALFRSFIRKYGSHEWVGKAYEKLGDSYIDLERYGKAVDSYKQAAAHAGSVTDKVYAYFKEGNAYLKINNPEKGVEIFKKVIETGEKEAKFERVPDSYYKIADYYYKIKEYKNALEYYKNVTRKYPSFQDTPWGLFQIANIYKNLREYDKAIKQYEELIEKHEDDYWASQAKWKIEDTVWEHEYRAFLK